MFLVVDLLCVACARVSSEGADRLDAAADSGSDNHLQTRLAIGSALQIPPWDLTHARFGRALGNSCINSNARPIFHGRNRTTCCRSLTCHDGGSWREFIWDVPPASPVLFCNDLFKFFSVVDQTAVVDPEAVGRKKGRDHPPSPTSLRTRLRRVERLRRTSRFRLQWE